MCPLGAALWTMWTLTVSGTVSSSLRGSSYSVVSEVIFLRQLLDLWVNLEVVEDVDALHITEAVVQFSRQLKSNAATLNKYFSEVAFTEYTSSETVSNVPAGK